MDSSSIARWNAGIVVCFAGKAVECGRVKVFSFSNFFGDIAKGKK